MLDFRIPEPEERFLGNASIEVGPVGIERYRRTLWNSERACVCVYRAWGYNQFCNIPARGKVLEKWINSNKISAS